MRAPDFNFSLFHPGIQRAWWCHTVHLSQTIFWLTWKFPSFFLGQDPLACVWNLPNGGKNQNQLSPSLIPHSELPSIEQGSGDSTIKKLAKIHHQIKQRGVRGCVYRFYASSCGLWWILFILRWISLFPSPPLPSQVHSGARLFPSGVCIFQSWTSLKQSCSLSGGKGFGVFAS